MSNKTVILIVGSNRANLVLLSQQLGQEGCEALGAAILEGRDVAKGVASCL